MVLYVNADRKPATRNDGRAAAANQLRGALIALDPKNEMGLQDLLTDVWRLPTETARESAFLGQSPQSPAEGAPAAAIVPPPVSADAEDIRELQALARQRRDRPDTEIVLNHYDPTQPSTERYGCLTWGTLRTLMLATGLFTDDMRPSQPPAADASVKPAEVAATPPPADADLPPDFDGEQPCTDPGGHKFECTGTAYGGDDERWMGEGRMLCIHCGADGDA